MAKYPRDTVIGRVEEIEEANRALEQDIRRTPRRLAVVVGFILLAFVGVFLATWWKVSNSRIVVEREPPVCECRCAGREASSQPGRSRP